MRQCPGAPAVVWTFCVLRNGFRGRHRKPYSVDACPCRRTTVRLGETTVRLGETTVRLGEPDATLGSRPEEPVGGHASPGHGLAGLLSPRSTRAAIFQEVAAITLGGSQLPPTSASVLVSIRPRVEQRVQSEAGPESSSSGHAHAWGHRLRQFRASHPWFDLDARHRAAAVGGCAIVERGAKQCQPGARRARLAIGVWLHGEPAAGHARHVAELSAAAST
jgi:hypothetical protein